MAKKLFVVCLIKSIFIANYTVPTGSMRKTIEPGDKLIVSKSASSAPKDIGLYVCIKCGLNLSLLLFVNLQD